jgi:formylglycine-generating enzyme required for sulfatase activity
LHRERIPRAFAVATKEVTGEQFARFRRAKDVTILGASTLGLLGSRGGSGPLLATSAVHPGRIRASPPNQLGGTPILEVTWYVAAEYCNWLSAQEGLPEDQWCFLPNDQGEYAEGMRLASNYLHRSGYRLPTEAEWEYACRAGAATSRAFGASEEMLRNYAWYAENSQRKLCPVGVLKPNDLGCFDMYGNAAEWTLSSAKLYEAGPAQVHEDQEERIPGRTEFVLRGGGLTEPASSMRSAFRAKSPPGEFNAIFGLRVARTLP